MILKIRTYPIEEMYPPIVVPVCTTFKPTEFETSLCLPAKCGKFQEQELITLKVKKWCFRRSVFVWE